MLSFMDVVRVLGSLGLVLVMLLGLLWMLRRLQHASPGGRPGQRMRLIQSLPLGYRQRALLLEVDGRVILLGLGHGQVAALGTWPMTHPADARDTQAVVVRHAADPAMRP